MNASRSLSCFLVLALVGMMAATSARGQTQTAPPKPENRVALEGRGFIVPVQQVQVGAEVAGRVVEVAVAEGQLVKRGEILARLDSIKYEIEVKRAQAVVELARARLEELKAGLQLHRIKQAEAAVGEAEAHRQLARANVERLRKLSAAKAVSGEELAQAEAQFRAAETQLEKVRATLQALKEEPSRSRIQTAQAEVAIAEADLEKARYSLERTVVRSPINGTVLRRHVEVGSLVNSGAFPLGSNIAEVADLTRLEVETPVSERDIARIAVGQNCEIRTDAFPNETIKGQVSRILPVVDRARGCFLVRVRIDLPRDNKMSPEMSARVNFLSRE